MDVYIALHEERYPIAAFSTPELAREWIARQEEENYTFSIEKSTVDSGESERHEPVYSY